MEIEDVIQWVLSNPSKYPGLHHSPQSRSSAAYKPLVPASQMQVIWKVTVDHVQEQLQAGRGVNMKGFGAFTFDIETHHTSLLRLDPTAGSIENQRQERKNVHMITPVFLPDPAFEYILARYHRKNILDKPKSQHSVFQKGFAMMFCNPAPIASSCFMEVNLVKSTLAALYEAIRDLARMGRELAIKFNFAVLIVKNRALEVTFNPRFENLIRDKGFEQKLRKSDAKCADFWKNPEQMKSKKSTLSDVWAKPNAQKALKMNEKTLALKVMSLDLASTSKPSNE